MRVVVLLLIVSGYLFSSMFDFLYLKDAKKAYENREYEKAAKLYQKVDSDKARFNAADSLYRQKKYKEAISLYKSIKDKDLQFKVLHNLGNSYANLNQIDKAIKSYEDALKIEDDKDTRYNLELLKQKKRQKENKKSNKDNKNQNQNKNKKNKNDKQNQNSKQSSKNKNENQKQQKENQQKQKSDKNKDKNQNQDQKLNANQKPKKQPPISDIEERKWQQKLNQRGINTLLLPLKTKGDRYEEQNPW